MAQNAAARAVKAAIRHLGYDLVSRHYYSPIPDLEGLPRDVWTRASELRGLDFELEAMLSFVQRELARYLDEYKPPRAPTGNPRDFHLDNGFYDSVDAETLYAMVRRLAPRRVLELGSGMSSLVIADARFRNDGPIGGRHLIFDPFPRADLSEALAATAELHRVSANDVPMNEFQELEAGDILFVDTSHTVKVGGEVNRIVLDILPALAPGVHVHVHDVYLPWEYPREFVLERSFFWAEQHLLQAFLAFNREFEILFGAHALQRRFPAEIANLVPSAQPAIRPSAFWFRRAGS
jgi:hypothetical protein